MNEEEFIEEVHQSGIAPENFDEDYSFFLKCKKLANDTLIAFHNVCEKNNLHYQLAYGSLLGAVRDGGQIPWDYDVDVFAPYEEKDALIEALKKDLDPSFYFYCPEVDPKCRHFIMRLAPKGFMTEELHVDVFYLMGAPTDDEERKKLAERITELSRMRFFKLVDIRRASYGSLKSFFVLLLRKLSCLFIPLDKITSEYRALCGQYKAMESDLNISCDWYAKKRTLPGKKMWNTMLYSTREGQFRVANAPVEVLDSIYKNYRAPYPIEKRLAEFTKNCEHLKVYKNTIS